MRNIDSIVCCESLVKMWHQAQLNDARQFCHGSRFISSDAVIVTGQAYRQEHSLYDAGLSAFSVFFTQTPSFLAYQRKMAEQKGKSNSQSLFGVHEIPSDNQIRNLLDPVPPNALFPVFESIWQVLERGEIGRAHV